MKRPWRKRWRVTRPVGGVPFSLGLRWTHAGAVKLAQRYGFPPMPNDRDAVKVERT